MSEENIRKYAQLMKELDLTGLEVKGKDGFIRLERETFSPAAEADSRTEHSAQIQGAHSGGKTDADNCYIVKSPMVGVFYSSSAEDADPYVALGQRVRKGDILCVVEAMKLLNEITADRDGIIYEIYRNNGDVVEYGSPLFKIGE